MKPGRKCRSQLWRYFEVPWSLDSHDRLHQNLYNLHFQNHQECWIALMSNCIGPAHQLGNQCGSVLCLWCPTPKILFPWPRCFIWRSHLRYQTVALVKHKHLLESLKWCRELKHHGVYSGKLMFRWYCSTVRMARCIDWTSRLINALWNARWQCWTLILSRHSVIFCWWSHSNFSLAEMDGP